MDSFLQLSDKNNFQELLDEYHLKKLRQILTIMIHFNLLKITNSTISFFVSSNW